MTEKYPLPQAILPHSYPFIFIDRIIEREEGKRIVCLKNVTFNEGFLQGHFKGDPVMPGVLMIEAMAQASGLIIGGGGPAEDKNKNTPGAAYLSRVNDARFKRKVVPGDQLVIRSSVVQGFPPLYVFEAEAYVGDELAALAEITLAIK